MCFNAKKSLHFGTERLRGKVGFAGRTVLILRAIFLNTRYSSRFQATRLSSLSFFKYIHICTYIQRVSSVFSSQGVHSLNVALDLVFSLFLKVCRLLLYVHGIPPDRLRRRAGVPRFLFSEHRSMGLIIIIYLLNAYYSEHSSVFSLCWIRSVNV